MKINELLVESLSRVAYHYSRLPSAAKIMASGEFELSSDLGSIEQEYSPKGYHYFLSTTRTKLGGYHNFVGDSGVMFVLDGNWFNQHYKSGPVDYWTSKNTVTGEIESLRGPDQKQSRKAHEAEDRVYSKTPTIPVDGVTAIHILIKPDSDNEYLGPWARTVLINAKRRGIPAYLYNDEAAWRRLDASKSQPISKNPVLRGQQHIVTRQSRYNRKGYLHPWLQLITATDKNQLSKAADGIRYSLQYTYDAQNALQGLGTEMSNARRPDSGIDRENASKIIGFMRKTGISDLKGLVEFLTDKWRKQGERERQAGIQI